MQHAAYVQLLGQHGRGHVAKALESALVRYAGVGAYRTHFADGRPIGWESGEEAYDLARQIMAQEMIDLVGNAGAGLAEKNSLGQANSILWRKLEGKERGVVARIDGSRVRLTGTPTDAKVQIETWATLTNQGLADVLAQVSVPGFPPGCVPVDANRNLEVGAGKSARTLLSLACEPVWLQTARETSLAIQVLAPDQPEAGTTARVSMIIAEPTARPLTIDGDLSDWAAASSNVASDFRLIAGPCEEPELACDRPALRTFAFTRRDADNLYVAVNAEARPPQRGPTARRKSVIYDDLIPMDEEDLIEILIDPLNGGTRSPADLYHIVVKRSGVYLIERGITTHPPLGPRVPWQADIDVASREQPTRWIAEVRIPLDSLGSPGRRGEIFGFNVTHYNAADQEFSTWAGAVGNAYDPLSLGNLFLP